MPFTIEEQRFLDYQKTYRETSIPQPPEPRPSTPGGKANQTASTKKDKYGKDSMSPEAAARARNQGTKI
jgi:hypothetical protein